MGDIYNYIKNKIIITIAFFLAIIAVVFLFYFYKPQQNLPTGVISNAPNVSKTCVDCGKGGWEKMDELCGKQIISKNDFKECLKNFSWSSVGKDTDAGEIQEGYIEIGSLEVLKNSTVGSIGVFIYHQWAVDKDGNLYLLGQLG